MPPPYEDFWNVYEPLARMIKTYAHKQLLLSSLLQHSSSRNRSISKSGSNSNSNSNSNELYSSKTGNGCKASDFLPVKFNCLLGNSCCCCCCCCCFCSCCCSCYSRESPLTSPLQGILSKLTVEDRQHLDCYWKETHDKFLICYGAHGRPIHHTAKHHIQQFYDGAVYHQ